MPFGQRVQRDAGTERLDSRIVAGNFTHGEQRLAEERLGVLAALLAHEQGGVQSARRGQRIEDEKDEYVLRCAVSAVASRMGGAEHVVPSRRHAGYPKL